MATWLRKIITPPFEHLKILNKLMFIYILGGLIPLLFVSIYFSSNTRSILIDRAVSEVNVNAERIEERLREVFDIATDVSDSLYYDEQLTGIINTNYTDAMTRIRDFNAYTRMDDFLRLYSEIDSIRIFVDNDTLLDDSQIIKATDKDKKTDWYQLATKNDGRMALIYKYDDYTRKEHLAVVRLVTDYNGNDLGILVVNISEAYLESIIHSEPYDVHLILDGRWVILSSNQEEQRQEVASTSKVKLFYDEGPGLHDINYNQTLYKVISKEFYSASLPNMFGLLTTFPVDQLTDVANSSVVTSIILIVFSVVVSLTMVYFLSRAFSKRIKTFRNEMHSVAQGGDFTIQSQVKGNDELGELSSDLNVMVASIQNLIHEVYESKIQKEQLASKQKEAQFKMLASQINPHFLYNALETIRMKAHISGQQEIATVVKKNLPRL